jgi:hypothetical protein
MVPAGSVVAVDAAAALAPNVSLPRAFSPRLM